MDNMELTETIATLKAHNLWRRDRSDVNQHEMIDPQKLGIAIDEAVRMLEENADHIEITERYRGEFAKLKQALENE